LLSQLSLDFAEQGIPTLWGSFEIKNTILIKKMLQQFSKEPLPTTKLEELEKIANNFEELPMHFLTFHGGSDIDEVLDAVHYSIHVYGVKHIILDNLQFMISRRNLQTPFDKFDVQDVAVEKFRQVATDMNVHVTLVVHPRKETEGNRLGISSIFGSAKVTQEADLILILQNEGAKKFLEVKKNRYDGTLGSCTLHFDPLSCRYVDDISRLTSNSRSQPRPNF
jgi:twinkle protein